MGDGTKENPYTREDVLRMIEENGGKAQGLDLSGKIFEEGIDLSGHDLRRIILARAKLREAHLEGANLRYAHLEGAVLSRAHLEETDLRRVQAQKVKMSDAQLREANLGHANLEGATLRRANLVEAHLRRIHLERANLIDSQLERADLRNARLDEAHLQRAQLQEANLTRACLEGANLHETEFSPHTKLVRVYWGNYVIGEERKQQFLWASDIYRGLKTWHTSVGMYNIAAEFYYREMEAKRKAQSWKRKPHLKLWNWFVRLLCGYGEKPERVVISAAVVVLGLALIYFTIGTLTPHTFLDSLYYSAVSFIALGYGQWAPQPAGWVKGLGVFEAFIGVFMMALFLVTFTRKMTR